MKASGLLFPLLLSLTANAGLIKNLNEDDFFPFIDENPHVFVKYCAPWYSQCGEVQADFEKAAEELKESNIIFAQVNCELEQELCINNGVEKYPKFQLHREGDILEYKYKENNSENFKLFINSFISPSVTEVNEESLEALLKDNENIILQFLDSKDSEDYQSLYRVSLGLRDEYKFAFTFDKELAKKYEAKFPSTVFIKKFNQEKNDVLEESITDEKLIKFINSAKLPLMDNLNGVNYDNYLEQDIPLFYFFHDKQEDADTIGKAIEEIARNYRLKMNFIYVDAEKYGTRANDLGIKQEWPAILIQNTKTKLKYAYDKKLGFEKEFIQKFINDYFDDKVKSFFHSEDLGPRDPNDHLIRMNAYTFEEVALDITKDVFVLFHADYCKPCRESIPILREMAAEIEPKNKAAIAYIDATKNDIPGKSPFSKIDGFPTLVLFRANRKNEPVLFPTNDYFKEDYIDFITQYAVNDITFEKQEDEEETEEVEETEAKEETKEETKGETKEKKDEL